MKPGADWEQIVGRELRRLERRGILRAVRTRDPWARIGRVFRPVANPWGDYAGCLRSGRLFVVECKSTVGGVLRVGSHLSPDQLCRLAAWERWGAVVWIVWRAGNGCCYAAQPAALHTASLRCRTLRPGLFRDLGPAHSPNLAALFTGPGASTPQASRCKCNLQRVGRNFYKPSLPPPPAWPPHQGQQRTQPS